MKRLCRSFLFFSVALVAAFSAPEKQARAAETASVNAVGGGTELTKLLGDGGLPLSVKMAELDSTWRRFVITDKSVTDLRWQILGARAGLEFGVHFTKGRIVTFGGEKYLVAYHLPVKIDPRILNWHGHGEPPRARKPTSETEMPLSLLNLRTIGSLNNLRPFNAETDVIDTVSANADSVETLQQLGEGVMRYIRARGVLPYLSNPVPWDANRVFYPYVGDERLYLHPATQEPYRWNEILSNKKVAHITDRQSMAVFYEATAAGDGTRGVLFLDGHVERLSPEDWMTIKRASKIFDDGDPDTAEQSGILGTTTFRQGEIRIMSDAFADD